MNNELNEEVLSDVLAALLAAFVQRLGVDKNNVSFDDEVRALAKSDEHLFSHALMDIHELLELELDYMPLTEFEKFNTVSDVAEYFYVELATKRGIL